MINEKRPRTLEEKIAKRKRLEHRMKRRKQLENQPRCPWCGKFLSSTYIDNEQPRIVGKYVCASCGYKEDPVMLNY